MSNKSGGGIGLLPLIILAFIIFGGDDDEDKKTDVTPDPYEQTEIQVVDTKTDMDKVKEDLAKAGAELKDSLGDVRDELSNTLSDLRANLASEEEHTKLNDVQISDYVEYPKEKKEPVKVDKKKEEKKDYSDPYGTPEDVY